MNTEVENIEVSIAEVAKFLGWKYTKAQSVKYRKPANKDYQQLLDAEKKIQRAKYEAEKTYQHFINK